MGKAEWLFRFRQMDCQKGKRRLLFIGVISVCLFFQSAKMGATLPEQPETEDTRIIIHTPVTTFLHGEKLQFKASVDSSISQFNFFFRQAGMEQYQVRPMEKAEDGSYIYELDTSTLAVLDFDYYFEARNGDQSYFFPASAPDQTVTATGQPSEQMPEIPQNLPSPEEEMRKMPFPLSLNGSIEPVLYEKQGDGSSGTRKITAGSNLRIFPSYRSRTGLVVTSDSNISYSSTLLSPEKKVDLSNLMIAFNQGHHSLKMGDINIDENQFTVSGLGRRGFDYTYDNQKTGFHIFNVSSQQPKGFKGFGPPRAAISIYGGSLSQKFFNDQFLLKAIFVAGKDDPGEGSGVGSSSFYTPRKGNVFGFEAESHLLKDKVNLRAEYARSNYDEDLSDDVDSRPDNALNFFTSFREGGLNIDARYYYTGKNFGSVGLQSMITDRKGYQANVGLTRGIFNLMGAYAIDQDNADGDLATPTSKDYNGSLTLGLNLSRKVSLNFGYRNDRQKTFLAGEEMDFGRSRQEELSGGLNLSLSQSAMVNIALTTSSQTGTTFPASGSSSTGLNIGGAFRPAGWLSLNPTFSYSQLKDEFSGLKITTLNTFFSSELTVVPEIVALLLMGGFNRSESGPGSAMNMFSLNGGLSFSLGRWIKIGQFSLALNGEYSHSKSSGSSVSNQRVLARFDFDF